MVDYVHVQHGDLDDAATVTALVGHRNLADYVGYGLDIDFVSDADPATDPTAVSITEGKVFRLLPTQYAPGADREVHACLVTAHYEGREVGLTGTGSNYIWAVLNMGTMDSPYITATETDAEPSTDAVLIGWVEPSTETVEHYNRDPDGSYESLAADDLTVRETITWPDGATTDTHPISYGETLNNRNDYYDEQADNPPGVVNQAADARNAEWARDAQTAETAAHADDSDLLEGLSADDILSLAESLRAQPWDPIFDEPYVDDTYDGDTDAKFNVRNSNYDYYRVRLQVENDSPHSDGLGCYINGITDNVYNQINLLPRAEYGNRVVHRTGTDTWTVGSTMGRGHSVHEFLIGLPEPIVGSGPRYRHPVFNAALQLTGGDIGSYQLSGNLTRSVKNINQIRIETSGGRLAIRAQVYGRMLFPDQY